MADFVMRGTAWIKAIIQFGEIGSAAAFLAAPWLLGFTSVAAWNAWLSGLIVLGVVAAAFIAKARGSCETLVAIGLWNMMAPSILEFAGDTPATMGHLLFGAAISMIAVADIRHQANTPTRRGLRGVAPTQVSELRSERHRRLAFRSASPEGPICTWPSCQRRSS